MATTRLQEVTKCVTPPIDSQQNTQNADKLYIVVLSSLDSGQKMAQACHAMATFALEHPEVTRHWHDTSNTIAVLEHHDLQERVASLEKKGRTLVRFHEPDMDNVLTAFCAEPASKYQLSHLRLAR